MKQVLDRWKEGIFVLTYFGFLAYFTPKANALGWGYRGLLFCVVVGALLVSLLYCIMRCIAEYLAAHREEVRSFREYMGLGVSPEQVSLASIDTARDHSVEEIDALLATNPYASAEVIDNEKYTRLLPAVSAEQDSHLGDETEPTRSEEALPGGKVAAILGENPHRRLDLAPNFQPDANDPLATGVFFVGIPGSGKTVAMALFLEQYITRYGLAVVAFDIEGDLKSIVEDGLCLRGMIAGPDTMPSMAYVIQHCVQLVVDLQQCRRPGEAFVNYELAAQLIARTTKELINVQAAISPDDRFPCLLALDETHVWTPQNPPSYLDPKTAKDILDTLTIVATRGRKYGVVPFLATQRIPKVHKDIIAGCETRILGKADLDNDIARYREYVSKEVISDQGIRSLGQGRMAVCMNGKRLIVQFHDRKSKHTSHTPRLTSALTQPISPIPADILLAGAVASRPVQLPQPEALPLALPSMKTHVRPKTRTSPESPLHQPIPFPYEARRTPIADELAAALEVYRPGMTYRDLGRALACSDEEARIIWQELRRRGLLRAQGSEPAQETRESEVTRSPQKPLNQADLERALQAYDEGNTTVDALALALGMTSWTVRPLYTAVKKLRKNAG
jgi:hypothetical protein